MFGWRKKRDGFEWRSYVRTTILVKRQNRREKLEDARDAALEQLAEAGRAGKAAGASGVEAAKKGLSAAGRGSAKAGGEIAKELGRVSRIAGHNIKHGAIAGGQALGAAAVAAGKGLGQGAKSAGSFIARAGRSASDRIRQASAQTNEPDNPNTIRPKRGVGADVSDFATSYAGRGLAVLLAIAVLVGLGWLYLPSWLQVPATTMPTISATPPEVIRGKAKSLTGDILMVGDEKVVLKGIEAPGNRQTCRTQSGRRWSCGREALNALRRVTGYETLECAVEGADAAGRKIAECTIGDKNIAAELVRKGSVFAQSGFFAAFSQEEGEARSAKRGLWKGTAQTRSEYRSERWQAALKQAPDGCPIKGKVRAKSRDNVYLMPWAASYRNYKVSKRRGDRWFCSEQEALKAGWKPLDR
ncbi:MAG: thermonuclease family protein [Filomicrobium sp.]